jgi:hypothetical protein
LKIQAFRDVKLCPRRLFDPEGGRTAVLWNAKNYFLIDSATSPNIIVSTSSFAPPVLPVKAL